MWRRVLTALTVMLAAGVAGAGQPSDSSVWTTSLRRLQQVQLDTVVTEVNDFRLTHHSFSLDIDSGAFRWLAPVPTDAGPRYVAAYFSGRARFHFRPAVSIERDQLRRFYDTDSLNEYVDRAVLFFDDSIRTMVEHAGHSVSSKPSRSLKRDVERLYKPLVRKEDYAFTFSALRALVHPKDVPFLLVMAPIDGHGQAAYLYDPYRREPVQLLRDHDIPGEQFMETVCSYTADIDETFATVNGVSTDQLSPRHVDIDATISTGGEYAGRATITWDVLDSAVQFVRMALHRELEVDSVTDQSGRGVPFLRYTSDSHKSEDLYLLLDQPPGAVDSVALSFFYHGDIVRREAGEFKVEAGASWYPRYGFGRRMTFGLRFRTPRDLTFIASADLVDSVTAGDTLYTTWQVTRPAGNISFNIGWFTRYQFGGDSTVPVDLYYNEPLHRRILKGSGRNTYKDVGSDIVGSLTLFGRLFGPFPFERLVVGEIIFPHGESFPGFIHMGANTFVSTDHWGEDHLFRSHEVAHQWWGSSLGYQTYHDQWLSEGFATYASLLYLQQEKGDDRYYDKLDEYAGDIFSARTYLFFDGAESGPIILGRRTASTRTEGDYNLIIYKKGALVLHMLRTYLRDWDSNTDTAFFDLMAEFYRTYAGKNATTADFQRLVERYTHQDMGWFFEQWVYHNELPEYRFTYDIEADADSGYARCRVTRESGPEDFRTLMPFMIEYRDGRTRFATTWIDQRVAAFSLPLDGEVKRITMNPFTAILAKVKQ